MKKRQMEGASHSRLKRNAAWLLLVPSACVTQPTRPPAAAGEPVSPIAEARSEQQSLTPRSGAGRVPATSKAPPTITRTLLDESDVPDLPGWETRLFLIEYAPGASAPLHHHPAPGVGYVLSGSFESAFEGGETISVHEGQSFRDLANVPHVTFKNASATQPLRFVISYVVRKGAPVLAVP